MPVPRPIENTDDAILMSYVGDEDVPAPGSHEYHHDDLDELEGLWNQVHRAIVRMLYRDVVHADLSSYNILVWDGEIVIIDFPQAVDAKKNQHAQAFLHRDVERLGELLRAPRALTSRGTGSRTISGTGGCSPTWCPRSSEGW